MFMRCSLQRKALTMFERTLLLIEHQETGIV